MYVHTQIRTASQKSTMKQDPNSCRSMEILVGQCSFYSNYLVQSSFPFGVGTPFPHLFF